MLRADALPLPRDKALDRGRLCCCSLGSKAAWLARSRNGIRGLPGYQIATTIGLDSGEQKQDYYLLRWSGFKSAFAIRR